MANALRSYLFEAGVRAAQWAGIRADEFYYCPLCGRGFPRAALDTDAPQDRRLTEEHVPPKSQGGRPLVLTCWDCNNTAGYTVDAALADREEQHRFVDAGALQQDSYSGPGRIRVEGVEVNVDMELGPFGGLFRVVGARNPPEKYEKVQEVWEEQVGAEPPRIRVSPTRPFHKRKAAIGDLKSAYLVAFASLGYLWSALPAVKRVREQIRNPGEEILDADVFWHWMGWGEDSDVRWIATASDPIHLIHVRLGRSTVLLPGWSGPEAFYKRAADYFGGENSTEVQLLMVPWPLTLVAELDRAVHARRGEGG